MKYAEGFLLQRVHRSCHDYGYDLLRTRGIGSGAWRKRRFLYDFETWWTHSIQLGTDSDSRVCRVSNVKSFVLRISPTPFEQIQGSNAVYLVHLEFPVMQRLTDMLTISATLNVIFACPNITPVCSTPFKMHPLNSLLESFMHAQEPTATLVLAKIVTLTPHKCMQVCMIGKHSRIACVAWAQTCLLQRHCLEKSQIQACQQGFLSKLHS